MSKDLPVILAIDDDPAAASALAADLPRRFAADYRVMVERSAVAGVQQLRRLRDQGADVALVLAGFHLRGMSGIDVLVEARNLHPDTRRVLTIVYGEAATSDNEIAHARALGQIDCYITKPWASPEEWLYVTLTELLSEWAQTHLPTFAVVRVVGVRSSPEAHHIRDLLDRNPVPHGYCDADSDEGRDLLDRHHLSPAQLPAAIFADGRVLIQPSDAEIATALGASTTCPSGLYDVAVVGGGPAGLAAAVYGASEGLCTVVLEREAVGGQAGTSSMIRNYLGFPRGISGGTLALRAFQQSTMFGADVIFMNSAVGLSAGWPHHLVSGSDGSHVTARTVVIATGARYRRIDIPEVEALTGAGVFYGAGGSEAQGMRDRRVFVIGAGNSAGQAALHLAKYASQVILLVRGDSLERSMSDYLIREIADQPNVEVRLQTRVIGAHGTSFLEALEIEDHSTGRVETERADGLFILIGAEPYTDWLPDAIERDERGYILTGRDLSLDCGCEGNLPGTWPLERQPYLLESSVPGVFAAGDVRHLSMKRVAAAVGEGSTAIALIHQYLREVQQPQHIERRHVMHCCERHQLMAERT
jgi:thioredoxin reductase (NADPH)